MNARVRNNPFPPDDPNHPVWKAWGNALLALFEPRPDDIDYPALEHPSGDPALKKLHPLRTYVCPCGMWLLDCEYHR